MPIPTRAVLFDFDGTLADSFAAITASTNHVRQSYGMPPLPESLVRQYVGYGLPNLMETLVPGTLTDEAVAHGLVTTRLPAAASVSFRWLHRSSRRALPKLQLQYPSLCPVLRTRCAEPAPASPIWSPAG